MRFHHHVHGSAITLSDDRTSARRCKNHFCNGLVFGDQPIKVLQKLCLELGCVSAWSGGIRIGITTNDPSQLKAGDLPKYAFPDLATKNGYWFCAVSEALLDTGTRLTVYVDSHGQLQVFINNDHKGIYLNHLPTNRQLWILFDIYGNTQAAKFVRPDDAPVEILARGTDAVRAYEQACSSGIQPLFRTRLMLVGQDGVGKTSLKRALIGQKHQQHEKSTDGIDLSASCSFNLRNKSAWRLALQGETINEEKEGKVTDQTFLRSPHAVEEEYNWAIAANIVHELVYQQRQSQEALQKQSQEASQKQSSDASQRQSSSPVRQSSAAKFRSPISEISKDRSSAKKSVQGKDRLSLTSKPSSSSLTADLFVPSDLLKSVPDRVVQIVQEMLEERKNACLSSARKSCDEQRKNIMLNIWDFAGQAVYYTTHQVFLTSRAVYVIVFNLCHNLLNNGLKDLVKDTVDDRELSSIGYMDFWMRSIHAHAAENARQSVDQSMLSPPIFIVGTHRNSLHDNPDIQNQMVEDKFRVIEEYLKDKPYTKHIVSPFIAVENSLESSENTAVSELRREIERVSSQEPYMGEQMPLKWLKFEQRLQELVAEGTYFVTYDQIQEMAAEEDIMSEAEVKTMLEFYHDLGVLIYYGGSGALDNLLRNTVILQPQWLIDMFKRIITAKEVKDKSWPVLAGDWQRLDQFGILQESIIDYLWSDIPDQKPVLLGLMEKFDLVCQRIPPPDLVDSSSCSYYVPLKLKLCADKSELYFQSPKDVTLYLDFNQFLPDGLFYRILTRAVRWCQECGGREPQLFRTVARFFLDSEHDFVLERAPQPYCRVKVLIMRVADLSDSEDSADNRDGEADVLPSPKPAACAKVRNFLDSTLSDLKAMWMRRISYQTCVECRCARVCRQHETYGCRDDACLHFLNLDECLANKVVLCEHRRVKTSQIKKWFPEPPHMGFRPVLPSISLEETHGNIEKQCPDLPSWVKGAAKLLNGGGQEQDWLTLAKHLGYKQSKLDKFNDDLNPALALLTDWIISSGNTALSVDVLVTYLEQMSRDDIVDVIQYGQESNSEPAQIFLSYQWDSQDEVRALRDRLERAGYTCWMDIGQMGGGDQLYTKIDEGIRNAKVIVACVSPKYTISHYCNRELSLADLIHKPIIPIVYEPVAWPPPGGMSLLFAQLVYINMKGVGGHGGAGVHADLEDKYNEIIQRISRHATPNQMPLKHTSLRIEGSTEVPGNSITSLTGTIGHYSAFSTLESGEPTLAAAPSLDVQRSPPTRTVSFGSNDVISLPQAVVEQVHVTKCGVCVIL